MSSGRQGRTAAAARSIQAAASTPATQEQVAKAEQEIKSAAAQVAVVAPAATSTPESKRGKSVVKFPVAAVWVTCMNMVAAATAAGQPVPSRTSMVAACRAQGIAFYTARTQVQAYLKASAQGTKQPAKLPREVSLVSAPVIQEPSSN
jgi:hypothetical protein